MEIASDEAQRVLKLIGDGIEEGREFVIEQAPLVVQEIVTYGRVFHTMLVCLGLAIGVLAIRAGMRFVQKVKVFICVGRGEGEVTAQRIREMDYQVPGIFMWLISLTVLVSTAITLLCVNFPAMCQAWWAPRLYVLETLIGLAS